MSTGLTVRAVLLALAVLLPARAPVAQSTLPDESSVVVTDAAVFLVPVGAPANVVLNAAHFGLTALVEPSVTWIRGTDAFLVTSRAVGAPGGLWRVTIPGSGPASVEDLGSSAPMAAGSDYTDAAYSQGLDTAFVLNREDGLVLALQSPAVAGGALLDVWATLTPGLPVSLDVNGALWPLGLVVVENHGRVLRLTKTGEETLQTLGAWDAAACNPVTGEWYASSSASDIVGKPNGMVAMDFNTSGFCGHIAQAPSDLEWDPFARRAVVLAEDGVACAFPGATGGNHVVRLPLTAGGGPASNIPVLLSFLGESGIFGAEPDFTHVRHEASDVTWIGGAGTAGDGRQPVFGQAGYTGSLRIGKDVTLVLQDAPPSAPGWLVVGAAPLFMPLQGQVLAPWPHLLLAVATDAGGELALEGPVPAATELLGLRLYMQWWLDDTTTPAAGDLVSSHAGVFTVGVK